MNKYSVIMLLALIAGCGTSTPGLTGLLDGDWRLTLTVGGTQCLTISDSVVAAVYVWGDQQRECSTSAEMTFPGTVAISSGSVVLNFDAVRPDGARAVYVCNGTLMPDGTIQGTLLLNIISGQGNQLLGPIAFIMEPTTRPLPW